MQPVNTPSSTVEPFNDENPLKSTLIKMLPIKGNLSTGELFEITVSRKSAVADGVHLVFSMEVPVDSLSSQ